MNNLGLVSIIVPIYNCEKYIAECVNSLLTQTYREIEILLIDDGSTDSSKTICDNFEREYSCVRTIHKINSGVSAARNIGLELSKGQFVMFCDSDDFMYPNMIEQLVKEMNKGADIVMCRYQNVVNYNCCLQIPGEIVSLNDDGKFQIVLANNEVAGYVWNKIFRRDYIVGEKPIYFDTKIGFREDELFVVEYLIKSKKIILDTTPLYGYRNNPNNFMNSSFNSKTASALLSVKKSYTYLVDSNQSEKIQKLAWQKMMKFASAFNIQLHLHKIDFRRFWIKLCKEIYFDYMSKFELDQSWSIKERIYFWILSISFS